MRRMALACLLLIAAPAMAEEILVLRSNTPTLPVGRILDGKAVLELPQGIQLVLMTAQGRSINLTGPYKGSPAPDTVAGADPGVLKALSGLATRGGVEASALGAYRNPPLGAFGADRARLSKAGDINPFAPDNQCAIDGKVHALRIKHAPKGSTASLSGNNGQPAALALKDGRATWPDSVPMIDSATYTVNTETAEQTSGRFTLRVLAKDPANEGLLAAELARHGCDSQARTIVSGMIRAITVSSD